MSSTDVTAARRKRTAVLVVHGIGSQRALETVRGVVRAVWFNHDDPQRDDRRIWTHPEASGVDIDLSVMTTNSISNTIRRSVDFHELYWAHLMSETKAVAVLLWLFELGRRGPRFKPGMNGLWWGGAVFLSLLILSLSLFAVQAIVWLTGLGDKPHDLLITLTLMLLVGAVAAALAGLLTAAYRVARWATVIALVLAAIAIGPFYILPSLGPEIGSVKTLTSLTYVLLPLGLAVAATKTLMGRWGLLAFVLAYALSLAFFAIYLWVANSGRFPTVVPPITLMESLQQGRVPWSMNSQWSAAAGWVIVAVYLIVNASFLQPYLGDAARYFRNSPGNVAVRREIRREAVDTLKNLHESGAYDRIIVVAHSLGSVVAYDMLRACYSSIHRDLPDPGFFDPEISAIDQARETGTFDPVLRAAGRKIIERMPDAFAKAAAGRPAQVSDIPDADAGRGPKVWLVTDFVTLGAALTHAYYLMCDGNTVAALSKDFERRAREREYPTCPPRRLDGDGMLTFVNPRTKVRMFHHGGLFALTRWSNLYFPLTQLFWGDAIGGPLAPIFGANVLDVPVSTHEPPKADFFTHTAYWDITRDGGRKAPHIVALRQAINLEDA